MTVSADKIEKAVLAIYNSEREVDRALTGDPGPTFNRLERADKEGRKARIVAFMKSPKDTAKKLFEAGQKEAKKAFDAELHEESEKFKATEYGSLPIAVRLKDEIFESYCHVLLCVK